MTLASSGFISLGGSTANRSVNVELGNSPTASITYPSAATRTLTGVSSGALVLPNDFWGKSTVTVSLLFFEGASPFQAYYVGSNPVYCYIELYPDGQTFGDYYPSNITGNWAFPTTSGIGSSYWVRFTRTSTSGTGGGSMASTGWLPLSSTQPAYCYKTYPSPSPYTATYTIELSTDSSGSPVVATATGVTLEAYGQSPPP